MIKSAVFVQARLSSKRLPDKILLPLNGVTVLEHCLRAAININAERHILLTDYDSQIHLTKIAWQNGFTIFAGDEENVLNRFCEAIKHYRPDVILRLTGDKVIVSYDYINDLLEKFNPYHDRGFVLAHVLANPWVQTVTGIYDSKMLLETNEKNLSIFDREHIKPYICKNFEDRILENMEALPNWNNNIKLTIDTKEDYEFLKILFRDLYKGNPIKVESILDWYNSEYKNT